VNQREAADPDAPVLIGGVEPFDLESARSVADSSLDLAQPLKGPFRAEKLDWTEEARAALQFARLAGMLPAFLVGAERAGEPQLVLPGDLAAWSDTEALVIATRAQLPIAAEENCEIVVFRSVNDVREHAALLVGIQ